MGKLDTSKCEPSYEGSTMVQFLCECKEQKGWISEGRLTEPCPNCGRVYRGEYSKKKLTIIPIEVKLNKIKEENNDNS